MTEHERQTFGVSEAWVVEHRNGDIEVLWSYLSIHDKYHAVATKRRLQADQDVENLLDGLLRRLLKSNTPWRTTSRPDWQKDSRRERYDGYVRMLTQFRKDWDGEAEKVPFTDWLKSMTEWLETQAPQR